MGSVQSRLASRRRAGEVSPPPTPAPPSSAAEAPALRNEAQGNPCDVIFPVPLCILVVGAPACGKTSLFLPGRHERTGRSYSCVAPLAPGLSCTLLITERNLDEVDAAEILGVTALSAGLHASTHSTTSSSSKRPLPSISPLFCGQRALCQWRPERELWLPAVVLGESRGRGGPGWDVRFDGGDLQSGVARERIRPLFSEPGDAAATPGKGGNVEAASAGGPAGGWQGIVVAYSVCDEGSFERAARWLEALRAAEGGGEEGDERRLPVLLLGTQLDLALPFHVSGGRDGREGKEVREGREVGRDRALALALECGADFCETAGAGASNWSAAMGRGYHWPAIAAMARRLLPWKGAGEGGGRGEEGEEENDRLCRVFFVAPEGAGVSPAVALAVRAPPKSYRQTPTLPN